MKHEFETDFELNIASIVDCLTVLITYLLASATFISLGMMQVTLPSFTDEYPSNEKPPVTVTVQVLKNLNLNVEIEGAETVNHKIDTSGEDGGLAELGRYLKSIQGRYPKLDGAVVAGADNVPYRNIARVVETTRGILPQVALGTEDVD